jgi:tetratricopeptide (TPR) repeat protein
MSIADDGGGEKDAVSGGRGWRMMAAARDAVGGFFASVFERFGGEGEEEGISRARAFANEGRPAEALEVLARLLGSAEAGGRIPAVVEILALRALVLHELGETEAARSALGRALSFGEREGYVNVFVNEGAPMAALLKGFLRSQEAQEAGAEASPSVPPEYVNMLLAMLRVRATLPNAPGVSGKVFVSRPYTAL